MKTKLLQLTVGPWPMNFYIIICNATMKSAIVDPGAEPDKILDATKMTHVSKILVTHAHPDHIGALEVVKNTTSAPVYLHPADGKKYNIDYDVPLQDDSTIKVGNLSIVAIHTPGHTPGMTCFDLGDGRIIVGDTIFVGGPGKTWSPDEFETTMHTMQNIVFKWSDETTFFPGHGPSGTIGRERKTFEAFVASGWSDDLYGDITWE